MFQTFSGSSRRPRQVNLSGRSTGNPFASGQPSFGHGHGQGQGHGSPRGGALANAQQDRLLRQQEREKNRAAIVLQKTWRGSRTRKHLRQELRQSWDQSEKCTVGEYASQEQALQQLLLLMQFADLKSRDDLERLHQWRGRWNGSTAEGPWASAYQRLMRMCISAITRPHSLDDTQRIIEVLRFAAGNAPSATAHDSLQFYQAVKHLIEKQTELVDPALLVLPLTASSSAVFTAYENFALSLLTINLSQLQNFNALAQRLNHEILGHALAEAIRERQALPSDRNAMLWLVAHFIYLYRYAHNFSRPGRYSSHPDFILVVTTLLASLVEEIQIETVDVDERDERRSVDAFVADQITSLVSQECTGGLLEQVNGSSEESRVLASYILTMLRLFPRRSDEIRMWLYLGARSDQSRPPVIRYFWQALARSDLFRKIHDDSRAATQLLRTRTDNAGTDIDDQCREMLIFFELYLFVLRIMDDEEFFSDEGTRTISLDDIEPFTTFLKHLGFTLYYDVARMVETTTNAKNIRQLFEPQVEEETKVATHIAGLQGISIDYVKGLVTGIIRQIYARDSRRPFLPEDHWLMTERFDMTSFTEVVVEEEERRHEVEDELEEEEHELEELPRHFVGTRHAQQAIEDRYFQRRQRRLARKRRLQVIVPRLEILQNMPFLIPFETRVEIFREFVYLDKGKRRNGIVDNEMWRLAHRDAFDPGERLERHHAIIRREHEFEDAYHKFFGLGVDLKEPIQITFMDQFGSNEAGIDGGGVTKEFLTSVTKQAFAATDAIQLFSENDQHLLFPNPSAVEAMRLMTNDRSQITTLLNKYEFLGRIIGKCMYEGILIDVNFAGFFLLKWALTGGHGSAPQESGYRASINDLRELDEALYQGLIKLKQYPGNVEDDFGLSFSITDEIVLPYGVKTITRDLKPNGASIPVTNANRLVYVADVARHRLQLQPLQQTNAFLRGISAIIEPSWLSMFNQSELQTLVGGAASEIDVSDLRENTSYGGVYVIGDDGLEHETVRIFWKVMESLDDGDRRKVLKFVTSTPRAPLLGFRTLSPLFSIRDAGDDQSRLPSTSTCVNLLKLPRYTNERTCRTKLLQAVNSGAGFDLS